MFHGYAEAGSHSVQVILDPFDQITETNQRDYYQKLAPATQNGLYLVPKVIE